MYLLRYAFAYAFEYSRMYLDVLAQMDDVNNISVISRMWFDDRLLVIGTCIRKEV